MRQKNTWRISSRRSFYRCGNVTESSKRRWMGGEEVNGRMGERENGGRGEWMRWGEWVNGRRGEKKWMGEEEKGRDEGKSRCWGLNFELWTLTFKLQLVSQTTLCDWRGESMLKCLSFNVAWFLEIEWKSLDLRLLKYTIKYAFGKLCKLIFEISSGLPG